MMAEEGVLLVAGPHVPESVLRRHCASALAAGRPVALVQLWPLPLVERVLLGALRRRYGPESIRLVETHHDWLEVAGPRSTVVLSDSGVWRDDERLTDAEQMLRMSRAAITALYAPSGAQPDRQSAPPGT